MDLSISIQRFYEHVTESSSNNESDDVFELMMATIVLLHEHSSRPLHRGSVKGHKANVKRNMRRAITNSVGTTSILPSHL
jgi:hypothetical protein